MEKKEPKFEEKIAELEKIIDALENGNIDLDESMVERYNFSTLGVYIQSVQNFSPAEKAGLQAGDIIIKADGTDIKTMDELNEIKSSHEIGDTITLTINRNGTEREVTITLEETP